MSRRTVRSLVGLLLTLLLLAGDATEAAEEPFDTGRFEKRTLVARCDDPMQLAVLPDGDLLFIERTGSVRHCRSDGSELRTVFRVPVAVFGEVGLLGLAIAPDFATSGHLYLSYCPADEPSTIRLSRFVWSSGTIDPADEIKLLDYRIDVDGAIHMGGGLAMGADGLLVMGTGDNCPPIPELPADDRPGREIHDAMRTSADSQDLRGKILRIRPEPDGSYTIPSGNLFGTASEGRPEIYAMGCRNPFRVAVDPRDGAIWWGDVGPNIALDLAIGPNGYDEVNRAPQAGNFGWPMFVGPNEAYRSFDFTTRIAGAPFDPLRPLNRSRNRRGLVELPRPIPAFLWYPSGPSAEFPELGSGGRSAMVGPTYLARAFDGSSSRLPDRFDGATFVHDWTRNWIGTVRVANDGSAVDLEAFPSVLAWRKPIDLQLDRDGSLLIVEYGDKWSGNDDATISRLSYVRGNRPPRAALAADVVAGRSPLTVTLTTAGSNDPDGDPLAWSWTVDGRLALDTGSELRLSLVELGSHRIEVTATDVSGGAATASVTVTVGNAPPTIEILEPRDGSFVDPGDPIAYRLAAHDPEDGSSDDGSIASARLLASLEYRQRLGGESPDDSATHPGLVAMRRTTCFSCHTTKAASAGPAYRQVALRYVGDDAARERLATKIVSGGSGVWGDKPMPPHPQHALPEARLMVDWILSLSTDESAAPRPGRHGFFRPESTGEGGGVWRLTAEYTDAGTETAPSLRSTDSIVLHSRRKSASRPDRLQGVELIDVFERGAGLIGRFSPGDWLAFDRIDPAEIDRIRWSVGELGSPSLAFALRVGGPTGPLLSRAIPPLGPDELGERFAEVLLPIEQGGASGGPVDLYVVAEPRSAELPIAPDDRISLAWLEFLPSPATVERRRQAAEARTTIVLIPTRHDHPPATHMYGEVCRLMAAALNETPGIDAIVSPDLDFPRDAQLLEEADALVWYSRPAGDIVFAPEHAETMQRLLARGIGLSVIHWATGAEASLGPRWRATSGGWFHFDHAELQVDRRPLVQVEPEHPICRGWSGFDLLDEFYLNLQFDPRTRPIVTVDVNGTTQTVVWGLERSDGGRSFGTTLGHFHDNWSIPEFRRLVANGILWSAKVEIPEAGSPVDVDRALLELPPPERPAARAWTIADWQGKLDGPWGRRSFERGERLFREGSCAACHRIGGEGGSLGPDLTEVRRRLAGERHPREALLRELLEPSARIAPEFRSRIVRTIDGQVLAGLVVESSDRELALATDPTDPRRIVRLSVDEIDETAESDQSMMPTGLLDPLDPDSLLDLLAYVESGGDPDYFAFRRPDLPKAAWSDPELPTRDGLLWWLDARTIDAGRDAIGLAAVGDGGRLDLWPDGSGHERHVRQGRAEAQPRRERRAALPVVRFDGLDDHLEAARAELACREATILLVVAPEDNRGWPGIVSGNSLGANDYRTGFNVDLMPEPKEQFETMMVEGPGFVGVTNLMRESFEFSRFRIVAISTEPGPDGVQVRIDGRPQATRGRDESWLRCDQLTVGARCWSNDVGIPPYLRGFLHGDMAAVLMYDRVFEPQELGALEAYLWEAYEPLLREPERPVESLGPEASIPHPVESNDR